jgi:hypothetical protein
MKAMLKLAGMLLLLVVMGLQSSVANAKTSSDETATLEVSCNLSAGDVTLIQTALANYVGGWTLSYVVNHMVDITSDVCDGDNIPIGGIISLEIDDEIEEWNWEREGSNIMVIWPT